MADVFRLKAIKPKLLQVPAILKAVEKEARAEGVDLANELKKTTASWEGDKPDFNPVVKVGGNDLLVQVAPTGNQKGVDKWNFLDKGTSIRWALMSSDWKSKTSPGKLAASGGSGRVVIAGRSAMQKRNIAPRPGIKARGWSKTVVRQNQRRFPNRIGAAIRKVKKF